MQKRRKRIVMRRTPSKTRINISIKSIYWVKEEDNEAEKQGR